ncbi:hypothetical protein ACVV62_08330 [Streptococcus pluranimalium]
MAKKVLFVSALISLLCFLLMFLYSWLKPGDFPFGLVFGFGVTLPIMLIAGIIVIIQAFRKISKK